MIFSAWGGFSGKSNVSTTPHGAPLWGIGVVEMAHRGLPNTITGKAVAVGVAVGVGLAVGVAVAVAAVVAVEVAAKVAVTIAVAVAVAAGTEVVDAARSEASVCPAGARPQPSSNTTPSIHANACRSIPPRSTTPSCQWKQLATGVRRSGRPPGHAYALFTILGLWIARSRRLSGGFGNPPGAGAIRQERTAVC
jgi:hypothetical protein